MVPILHHREIKRLYVGRPRNDLFFLLTLLLMAISLRAADVAEDYLVDVWTSEKGLPDSSVAAIAQTPEGYLWIGTYNGLARFDGVRFVTFDPANTPALAHAGVRKLSVDDRGTLWINTFDGSLTSLRNGVFAREWTGIEGQIRSPDITLITSGSNQVTFLFRSGELRRKSQDAPPGTGWEILTSTNRAVGALCVADGEGTIWYRGGDYRLFRLRGTNFEPVLPASGLVGNWVNCMTTDSKGRLWVGTDKQIAMWRRDHFEGMMPTNGAPEVQVGFLSIGDDGHFWAGVDNQLRRGERQRWVVESVATTNVFTRMVGRMGARYDSI
jgi:ligand-binding sensor domain-containing protein